MDGRLPRDCFYDEVRSVVMNFTRHILPLTKGLSSHKDPKGMPTKYQSLIPRWHKQPNYVEVWVEKSAMIGSLRPLVLD